MGTTLELHSEVKIVGKWHHYGCPNLPRNYQLFDKMAGIRHNPDWGIDPLAFTVGMPGDATDLTKLAWRHQPLIRNQVRVLDRQQIELLTKWWEANHLPHEGFENVFDYLFHNAWCEQTEMGVEDCRFIFWET